MKQDKVTQASVLASHLELTRAILAKAEDYVVVAHDTTELDFTTHETLNELGQIGNGSRRG